MQELSARAHEVLEAHWRPPGFCVPHADVYPVLFLWDSAFHVVAWLGLGRPDRAVVELASMFAAADEGGFVPHMAYHLDPAASVELWGRRGASSITQPPMYGHAVAQLVRGGHPPDRAVVMAAERGLRWLVDERRLPDGTIAVLHPWETGMDDSPRWDGALVEPWTEARWYRRKGELVASLETDDAGIAVGNPHFQVGSAGFTALVAFNLLELGEVTASATLTSLGEEVAHSLDPLLRSGRGWVDGAGSWPSGGVRTLDGLLPLLVAEPTADAMALVAQLVDPAGYGGPYGPAFVHRDEAVHAPGSYWRGSVWPHMTYLAWWAARRLGAAAVATELAGALRRGARAAGLAEHWHADTGAPLGAVPLSWSALAAVV